MKNIKGNNLVVGTICAVSSEVLFGLSYAFTKSATNEASALALLGWRFFLQNVAIATTGVNRTSSFIGVSTVVSIFSGALILRESFTLLQGFGALVIIAGVYIANASNKKLKNKT